MLAETQSLGRGAEIAVPAGRAVGRSRVPGRQRDGSRAIPMTKLAEVVEKLTKNAGIEREVAAYAAQDAARFGNRAEAPVAAPSAA